MKIGHPADTPAAAARPVRLPPPRRPRPARRKPPPRPPVPPIRARPSPCRARPPPCLSGGATGEFDAEKVARMSEAIASGNFKINAEAIADKLIANAQELLVKVKT